MSRELTNAQHDEYMNTFIRNAHRGRFAAPEFLSVGALLAAPQDLPLRMESMSVAGAIGQPPARVG